MRFFTFFSGVSGTRQPPVDTTSLKSFSDVHDNDDTHCTNPYYSSFESKPFRNIGCYIKHDLLVAICIRSELSSW